MKYVFLAYFHLTNIFCFCSFQTDHKEQFCRSDSSERILALLFMRYYQISRELIKGIESYAFEKPTSAT